MERTELESAIELGAWTGRKQAFSGLAARCSAADAQCLREIREGKKYRAANLTWDEFCPKYLGISRALADKTIRLLEEFGSPYFYLSGLIRITPGEYRRIAGSVSESGLRANGECIAIEAGNAVRLAEAVESLNRESAPALPAPEKPPKDPLCPVLCQLQTAVDQLEQLLDGGPGRYDRALLTTVLGVNLERLGRLSSNMRA